MGKVRDKLELVRFRCDQCDARFKAGPDRIEDSEATPWHPWEYFASCPHCGVECAQDAQERGLLKAWAKATGPKTAEGKAIVAKNLAGHPTPEEATRTRFNAMKHGLNAEVATYFPARPGGYPHCNGCPYLYDCHPGDACQKRTELFLRHQIAFDSRDPSVLTGLRARLHAMTSAILEDMLLAVVQDGARIKTPAWYYDKDGSFHLARYRQTDDGERFDGIDAEDMADGEFRQLYEISEHPLLKRIGDWIKTLGLDLNSQGMTPKVQEETDSVRGNLQAERQNQEQLLEFQRRQTESLEKLGDLIDRSKAKAAQDPVLIEHQRGADAQ